MNTIYRFLCAIIAFSICEPIVNAQNNDKDFEPIHSTLYPTDPSFSIIDRYGKNSSVYFVGDELMLQSSKNETALAAFPLPINPANNYSAEFSFNCPSLKHSIISIGTNNVALNIGFKSNVSVFTNNQQVYSEKKWKIPEGEEKNDLIIKFEKRNRILTIYINNKFVYETEIQHSANHNSAFYEALNYAKNLNSTKTQKQNLTDPSLAMFGALSVSKKLFKKKQKQEPQEQVIQELENVTEQGLVYSVAITNAKKGELLLKSIRVDQGAETDD